MFPDLCNMIYMLHQSPHMHCLHPIMFQIDGLSDKKRFTSLKQLQYLVDKKEQGSLEVGEDEEV